MTRWLKLVLKIFLWRPDCTSFVREITWGDQEDEEVEWEWEEEATMIAYLPRGR